jgi:hypothetical protein
MPSTLEYYSLIAKAISGLDDNTFETRQALYHRARTTLRTQLQRQEPPPSNLVIANEMYFLEAAICQAEDRWSPSAPSRKAPTAKLLSTLLGFIRW